MFCLTIHPPEEYTAVFIFGYYKQKLLWIFEYKFLHEYRFSISLGWMIPNATAGLFDNFTLSFIRNGWTIFQSGYIILYSVRQCMDCSIFSRITFSAITIFPFNQCKECIEIAHWGFNLELLDSNWCYYFPCAYLPYQYSLTVIFAYVFFPFLKFDFFPLSWLLSFESSLLVLDTILLAHMKFENILSQLKIHFSIFLTAKSWIW